MPTTTRPAPATAPLPEMPRPATPTTPSRGEPALPERRSGSARDPRRRRLRLPRLTSRSAVPATDGAYARVAMGVHLHAGGTR